MSTLIFFAVLSVLGFLGVAFLAGRKIASGRTLSQEEKRAKVAELPAFFDFVREDFFNPLEEFVANSLRPALFKSGEKFLRRFRIFVLKAENVLHRLSNYFRGRRIAIKNGKNSDFWNEMHEAKNGFKNSDNEK